MKIEAIEITHHRLDLEPPFKAAWDGRERRHFDATVVRVRADNGAVGIGSGDLMVGFEGHEDLFIGHDPLRIERHWRTLDNIDFHYGRCWPLDLALWDLAGKLLNQPVWRLLGGLNDRVRAYASLGAQRSGDELADQCQMLIARGFPAAKIRFQRGDWHEDVRALEQVRSKVGERLELMVDCNQGWRMPWDTQTPWTFKDALTVARELERLGVYWMEEPLHRADLAGMRRLRESTDVRIAAGEMTRSMGELHALVLEEAVDVVQPDAALTGGITGLRRIATLATQRGVTFTPHTWTNGLGVVANAHLTAGLVEAPFLEFPFDPPHWPLAHRDFLLAEPFEPDGEGWLNLSDAPGLGVELDEARLRKTAI